MFSMFSVHGTAQEESRLRVVLCGGLSLPHAPEVFKKGSSNGFNMGGGINYRVKRQIAFQALVNYDRFPLDEEGVLDQTAEEFGSVLSSLSIQGADASFLSVSGEFIFSFIGLPNTATPYAIAGMGMARISVSDVTISGSFLGADFTETTEGISETNPLAFFGAGVYIPLDERIGVLVEGRYQFIFREDERTNFVSLRGGVRIGL